MPGVGIELQIVFPFDANPVAAGDAVDRHFLPDQVELGHVVIHRILVLPHQPGRAPAAGGLEADRHLDVAILRAGEDGDGEAVGR
jgi:hypothetical protein